MLSKLFAFLFARERATVDTILATFHRTTKALTDHAEQCHFRAADALDEALHIHGKAQAKFAQVEDHKLEAARAETVAAKLATLLS